ncbi:MAG: urease accessory protein UreD [Lactobacillus sp.]|jgi:urease accessory protein|nr:urease accessory protein UreD [Lactobacillus sp.]
MDQTPRKLTGTLSLDVIARRQQSIPHDAYFQGAFKLMRPQHLDDTGQLMYCLLNPGGGYLDGDRYQMVIRVHDTADLYLTAQSATKIYKTPKDQVRQDCQIEVGDRGILEFTADPIIPFQDARYTQDQVIHLKATSALFLSEVLTPGWSQDKQGFQYDYLNLRTRIYLEDKLQVWDALVLEPKVKSIHTVGLFADYTHYGSIYIVHPLIDPEFEAKFEAIITDNHPEVYAGISQLNFPGLAIRILGNGTEVVQATIDSCQKLFRQALLGRENALFKKY